MKRLWSGCVAAVGLAFVLACGGLSPEELALQDEAQRIADEMELEAKGPALFVKEQLSGICSGTSVNLVFGLKGHEDVVAPLALDKVAYTRWIDGGLGDQNNGKVVELGPKDVDWYYTLEAYCSDRATCADTACTMDLGDSAMSIEHRIIDGEARIVGAFKGDSLSGDKAGVSSAMKAWQAEMSRRHPVEGAAPAAPAEGDEGGDEVATKPDPKPRDGAGGGGGGGGGGGKGRGGRGRGR